MRLVLVDILVLYMLLIATIAASWKLKVGVMYTSTGPYAYPYSQLKIHAATMWANHENTNIRGLNSTMGIEVELSWYDTGVYVTDALTSDVIENANITTVNASMEANNAFTKSSEYSVQKSTEYGVNYLINNVGVLAIFPSQDPLSINITSNMASQYGILVLTGMSGDNTIFNIMRHGTYNAMSTMTPGIKYMAAILQKLCKPPLNAKTVAYLTTESKIHSSVTIGSITDAVKSNYQVVTIETLPLDSRVLQLEIELITAALKRIQQLSPNLDVLIVATWNACKTVPRVLKSLSFMPKALVIWECPNQITTLSLEEQELLSYVYVPAQTDPRLIGDEYTDDIRERNYATMFPPNGTLSSMQVMLQAFEYQNSLAPTIPASGVIGSLNQDPLRSPQLTSIPYNALFASEMAAYYILDFAVAESIISISNDLTLWSNYSLQEQRSLILTRAQSVNIMSYYGKIAMIKGINLIKPMVILQVNPLNQKLDIVYPDASIKTKDPLYPAPKWNERYVDYSIFGDVAEKITILGMTSMMITFSIIILIGLVYFRKKSQIRSSSMILTLIIVIGCIVCFGSIFTWAHNNTIMMCRLRIPVTILGFSVVMWTLILKEYRIVKIFESITNEPIRLPNSQLIKWLVYILVIVFLIFSIWFGVYPMSSRVIVTDSLRPVTNYLDCRGNDDDEIVHKIFWILLAIYVLIVLAIACYYASRLNNSIKTISSAYEEFDESKSIAYLVYNTVVCILTVLILQYVEGRENRYIILIARSIILNITFGIMLIILAGQRVFSLLHNNDRVRIIKLPSPHRQGLNAIIIKVERNSSSSK